MEYLLIFSNARFTPSNIESCVKDKSFFKNFPVSNSNSSTPFWYTSKSNSKFKINLKNSKIFKFNSILVYFWKSSSKLFAFSLSVRSRSENFWTNSKAFNSSSTKRFQKRVLSLLKNYSITITLFTWIKKYANKKNYA